MPERADLIPEADPRLGIHKALRRIRNMDFRIIMVIVAAALLIMTIVSRILENKRLSGGSPSAYIDRAADDRSESAAKRDTGKKSGRENSAGPDQSRSEEKKLSRVEWKDFLDRYNSSADANGLMKMNYDALDPGNYQRGTLQGNDICWYAVVKAGDHTVYFLDLMIEDKLELMESYLEAVLYAFDPDLEDRRFRSLLSRISDKRTKGAPEQPITIALDDLYVDEKTALGSGDIAGFVTIDMPDRTFTLVFSDGQATSDELNQHWVKVTENRVDHRAFMAKYNAGAASLGLKKMKLRTDAIGLGKFTDRKGCYRVSEESGRKYMSRISLSQLGTDELLQYMKLISEVIDPSVEEADLIALAGDAESMKGNGYVSRGYDEKLGEKWNFYIEVISDSPDDHELDITFIEEVDRRLWEEKYKYHLQRPE